MIRNIHHTGFLLARPKTALSGKDIAKATNVRTRRRCVFAGEEWRSSSEVRVRQLKTILRCMKVAFVVAVDRMMETAGDFFGSRAGRCFENQER
jgi:hypothetical protein